MKLCFWNDGSPRVVRPKQKVTLDNGDIMIIGKTPSPDLDLFEFEEVGPTPTKYQTVGQTSYDNDGWKVTATRSVVDKPDEVLADIRKTEIKVKRDSVINAGIEWNGYVVQTDPDSRREMVGAVSAMSVDDTITAQPWRMQGNTLAVLDKADFLAMSIVVRNHVNACYLRQAELEADNTLDIQTGWPTHYVEPVAV